MERKYSFHKEKVRLIIGESNYQKKQRLSWHKNLYLFLRFDYVFVIIACALSLIPYILIFVASFCSSVNIRKGNLLSGISISDFTNNWNTLTRDGNFFKAFTNSIFVTLITTILGLLIAGMAGYAYIVYRNKLTNKLFYLSFFSIMIPSSVTLVPLFILLQKLHMLNSLFTVILTSLSLPFLIYLFRQNTKLFPKELVKSARVDGLSELGIFFLVFIPNMSSVFVTAGIILFIDTWNSLLFPLIIIQSQEKMTLSVYINSIGSSYTSDYGAFMLALSLATLPIILLFIVVQKHFRMGMRGI